MVTYEQVDLKHFEEMSEVFFCLFAYLKMET